MVGARAPGTEQISQLASFFFYVSSKRRKMMFFEGCPVGWGGTHRSWPGGQGGKLRALVAGEGWGSSKEGEAPRPTPRPQAPRASVPAGVGGRGTGPRDGANFATCVVFLTFLTRTKRRKKFFLKEYKGSGGGVQGLWFRGGRW